MEKESWETGHPPSPSLFSEPAQPEAPRPGIPYGGSLLGAYRAAVEGFSVNPERNSFPSLSLPASLNGTGKGRPTRFLA